MGATQSTQHSHVLKTSRGSLSGTELRDQTGKPILQRYFKIPFAQPPVGNLRWRRPQPLPSDFSFDKDGKPGDYTKFGPICPQPVYNIDAALVENPNAAPPIENVELEDCLYLNIFVPAGTPPEKGWPVQVYIYGGWLQIGNAMQSNEYNPFDLLANSTPRIIVSATYRINLFGFAAGADLASETPDPFPGNFGFWDQRLALEWTHENISLFGGNPNQLTVSGLSAGAHSTFLQLYHDTYLPPSRQIIKQVHLISNAIAIQPNPATSEVLTKQFNSICTALSIPTDLPPRDKLAKLRATSWEDLVATIPKLEYHTFRACTDGPIEKGGFVPANFLATLHDGSFATRLAERGTRIVLGEVRDEAQLYKLINPPSDYDGLITQLCNYYPRSVVDALVALPLYNVPKPDDEVSSEQWADVFAAIVADGQVHASVRGLTRSLLEPPRREGVKPVPKGNLFRYRICWRAKGLDNWIKPEVGLCHASDTPIWWAGGYRMDYTEEDKRKNEAFVGAFGKFLEGKDEIGWGGSGSADEVRLLNEEGNIQEGWKDQLWERGQTVWDAIWNAQKDQVAHS